MTKKQYDELKKCQKVFANGYNGTFIEYCPGVKDVIHVRLPGGVVAIEYSEVKLVK